MIMDATKAPAEEVWGQASICQHGGVFGIGCFEQLQGQYLISCGV